MKLRRLYRVLAASLFVLAALTPQAVDAQDHGVDGKRPTCVRDCITEYQLPPATAGPFGIVTGPDRAIWFSHGDTIGRMTLDGQATDYAVPTPNPVIGWLHVGPDRAIWFAERVGNKIGRITLQGTVTEYPIPTASGLRGGSHSIPQGITTGRDGNLWFTEECGNKIGRITLDGVITEYAVPTPDSGLLGITAGPDGALWFVEKQAEKIGRITLRDRSPSLRCRPGRGRSASPSAPTGHCGSPSWGRTRSAASRPMARTPSTTRRAGRWASRRGRTRRCGSWRFTGNSIGRMNLAGQVTHSYAIPTAQSGALQITVGPDRALWFTEGVPPDGSRNALGRLQPFKRHGH